LRNRSGAYRALSKVQRFTAAAVMCAAFLFGVFQGAAEAETRTLKLYNTHTKEKVSVTFKKNGRYVSSGLREANRFLRDWRRNEITKIDPKLLDLVWEVYKEVGGRDYIYVVSSYRSPATNNMLRKRSKGVAKKSQHTLGKAMDFYIPGVNLSKLRKTGMLKQVGGVGYYPRSGSPFVHMDTGSVRHWPRMSRSQLARVFPDGKTLHMPTDRKPMKRYKEALALERAGKLEKLNKGRFGSRTAIASNTAPRSRANSGDVIRPSAVSTNATPRARTTGQSVSNGDVIRPTAAPRNSSNDGGNLLASLFTGGNSGASDGPTPPGAIATRATPAAAPSPVVQAPPVPLAKTPDAPAETPEQAPEPVIEDRVILANIAPAPKPKGLIAAPIQVASTALVVPGTLDGQRVALEQGAPNPAIPPAPAQDRFDVSGIIPNQKPQTALITASLNEAVKKKQIADGIPIPPASPVDNAVSAIAAVTGGTATPAPMPARPPATLAYASAAATQTALRTSLASKAIARAPQKPAVRKSIKSQQTLSGRIPKAQIQDPLSGFVGLPDKSAPQLLSGDGTMRRKLFASLRHPDQRRLKNFFAPSNRFVKGGFNARPYGNLRSDRFEGPAIVVLPVTFAK